VAEKRQEVRTGTADAPTFYANNVNVQVTTWDLRLRFSQIESVDEKSVVYRDMATVYLSPGQARALRKVLNDNFDTYETIWASQDAVIAALGTKD
jgi:uncharacterized protein DUF3467